MRKKLGFMIALVLLLGGSALAFAWWDNLEETQSENIVLGEGVRISVSEDTEEEDRLLVPAGSFYADFEDDYTTEYVFTYTVSMENPLEPGYKASLNVSVDGWNVSSPALDVLQYTIEENGTTTTDESLTITDAFSSAGETYTITVEISIAGEPDEEDEQDVYDALVGGLEFDVNFSVTDPVEE